MSSLKEEISGNLLQPCLNSSALHIIYLVFIFVHDSINFLQNMGASKKKVNMVNKKKKKYIYIYI